MGTTTFSGPVKAGPIREGASANVGTLVCAQSAAITENGSASDTGIIIPANSQIINMYVLVQTAWDGGTNTMMWVSRQTRTYMWMVYQFHLRETTEQLLRLQAQKQIGETLVHLMLLFMLILLQLEVVLVF